MSDITVQAKINTARVQAGSQYAAIESAINYTTDLQRNAQMSLDNTVNDVLCGLKTKSCNSDWLGQQGLLQLIQV